MAYVALRPFSNQLPDGSVVQLYPGDEVVGFALWPLINQTASINANLVRQSDPTAPKSIDALAAEARNETGSEVRQHTDALVALAVARKAACRAADAASDVPAPEAQPVAMATPLSCAVCDYTAKTAHGIKIHMGRAHADLVPGQ